MRLLWTRRSRASTPWQDYLDTPLGEAAELYHVACGSTHWDVSSAALTLLIADLPRVPWTAPSGGALTLSIRQIGETGASKPLVLTIPDTALS